MVTNTQNITYNTVMNMLSNIAYFHHFFIDRHFLRVFQYARVNQSYTSQVL